MRDLGLPTWTWRRRRRLRQGGPGGGGAGPDRNKTEKLQGSDSLLRIEIERDGIKRGRRPWWGRNGSGAEISRCREEEGGASSGMEEDLPEADEGGSELAIWLAADYK